MKDSFTHDGPPWLMGMLNEPTISRLAVDMRNAMWSGAQCFGIEMRAIDNGEKTDEGYRRLVEAAEGRPIYGFNYRDQCNEGKTDDRLMDELIEAADCGFRLCDVMMDTYDRQPTQISNAPEAVERQISIIKQRC